jgi:chemotaxis protein MotB
VANNDTPEGRVENRRIDLVVMPRSKINFAAPGPDSAASGWHKVTDGE